MYRHAIRSTQLGAIHQKQAWLNLTAKKSHLGMLPCLKAAIVQDPHQNNPTYQLFYPSNNSLSTPLTLTILLESWPVNTYPHAIVLPTGSTLIIAGMLLSLAYLTAMLPMLAAQV